MTVGLLNLRVGYTVAGGGSTSGTLAVTEAQDIISFGVAQVAFDAASNAASASTGTLSWTHTPVGTPSAVIVTVLWYDGEFPILLSSATYGGVPLIQVPNGYIYGPVGTTIDHGAGLGPDTGNYYVAMMFYLGSPPTGAQTVTLNWNGIDIFPQGGAITVTGSDTTNVFSAPAAQSFGTSTTPSVIIPSRTGELTIDICGGGQSWTGGNSGALDGLTITNLTTTGSNTRQLLQTSSVGTLACSTASGASSVTSSWSKAGSAAAHWYMLGASIMPASARSWKQLPVNGGGFVTRVITNTGKSLSDGTTLVRSDTPPGLYRFNRYAGTWDNMCNAATMPAGLQDVHLVGEACIEAAICPSNTSKIHNITQQTFLTWDGIKWVQPANQPAGISAVSANDGQRGFGPKMAVDPVNENVVLVGATNAGLQYSADAGATTWTTLTVGSGAAPIPGYLIAFDPTSTITSGKTQGIFCMYYGTGVYHSTNGGTSWTFLNTTGMPTAATDFQVDASGKLWVCAETGSQNVWTWTSGGGWVNNSLVFGFGVPAVSIAIDPNNVNHIVALNNLLCISTNGGSTWSSSTAITSVTVNGDAFSPWMQTSWASGSYSITAGNCRFDYLSSGKLWQPFGFGVMYAANPFTSATVFTFTSQSHGIESLDGSGICFPPGGNPIGSAWDLPGWNFTSQTTAPSNYKPAGYYNGINPNGVGNSRFWGMDYEKGTSTPSFLAVVGGTNVGGMYSTNKGATWTAFASQTPFGNGTFGGSMAVQTSSNMVTMLNTGMYYTTNGGTSWTACTYGGSVGSSSSLRPNQFVCADPNNSTTYYAYSTGGNGIYKSTDSGATWAQTNSGSPLFLNLADSESVQLRGVPGKNGHFFICGGYKAQTPPSAFNHLWFSSDACVTWTQKQIGGTDTIGDTFAFDFGTTVAGQSYPTVYFVGYTNSNTTFGIWKTNDNFATVQQLGASKPLGFLTPIQWMCGDPGVDNACYISYFGGGFQAYR